MRAYLALQKIFNKISNLEGAAAILHWDAATMMPKGSADARAEQFAVLETLSHEMLTKLETSNFLDKAEAEINQLNEWQAANLKLMRRSWMHAKSIHEGFIKELTEASTKCEMVWRDTRAENNFSAFVPHQQRVLDIVREIAAAKAEYFSCSPYDALLDTYDPGRKSEDIDKLFADLKAFLPDFIQKALEKQKSQPKILPLKGSFPIKKQEKLGRIFMDALGFNFEKGRIDISHHPFCGGIPEDVRITTRYDENDFTSAMMGVLHESGHALYESGLPEEWRNQPVGETLGMSIHESQSLLMEMQVCRSRDFIEYAAPIMAKVFGKSGAEWKAENLYRIYTKVRPGLIRVDADEVTYPAHVILRYEIEKDLIAGKMEVKHIPDAWNAKMKEMLGVEVPDYKNGCMQDIHWPDGAFGYFPTYTIGAMVAAQFFATAKKQNPEIVEDIRNGNFKSLLSWLRENIHSQASRLTADELLEHVTGKKLDASIYKEYLKNRYLS